MRIVELAFGNGQPVYVNPDHVVSVMKASEFEKEHSEFPGDICILYLAQPNNGWIIRGTPAEVIERLGN